MSQMPKFLIGLCLVALIALTALTMNNMVTHNNAPPNEEMAGYIAMKSPQLLSARGETSIFKVWVSRCATTDESKCPRAYWIEALTPDPGIVEGERVEIEYRSFERSSAFTLPPMISIPVAYRP